MLAGDEGVVHRRNSGVEDGRERWKEGDSFCFDSGGRTLDRCANTLFLKLMVVELHCTKARTAGHDERRTRSPQKSRA